MTHARDMLLSAAILKLRKQTVIWTTAERRDAPRTFGGIGLGGSGRTVWFLMEVQLGLSAVFLQEEVRGSNELKKSRS